MIRTSLFFLEELKAIYLEMQVAFCVGFGRLFFVLYTVKKGSKSVKLQERKFYISSLFLCPDWNLHCKAALLGTIIYKPHENEEMKF